MIQILRQIARLFKKEDILKSIIEGIKDDIIKTVEKVCAEKFNVIWYGAYYINPQHLVFWICVKSDKVKKDLQENKILMNQLRSLLELHDYPIEARLYVGIGFESQETVDRESNGNWYFHFK